MSLIIGSSSIADLGKIQNLSPENNIRLEKQKEKDILNNILTQHTKDRDNFNKRCYAGTTQWTKSKETKTSIKIKICNK